MVLAMEPFLNLLAKTPADLVAEHSGVKHAQRASRIASHFYQTLQQLFFLSWCVVKDISTALFH